VGPEVLKLLVEYDWPGNVRELENVIERAVVLSPQREITVDLVPEHLTAPAARMKLDEISILDGQSLFEIVDCFEKEGSLSRCWRVSTGAKRRRQKSLRCRSQP
jgi:DNA-binding NtrC family response regulator